MLKKNLLTICVAASFLLSGCNANLKKNDDNTAEHFYKLGESYEQGINGYPQDIDKAILNYKIAVEKGSVDGLNALGVMEIAKIGENGKITEKAKTYFTLAAEKGDEIALFNLGNIENSKSKLDVVNSEAINYYLKAASKGYSPAYIALGDMYATGVGVHVDYAKAEEYFIKAADLNDADAVNRLSVMYLVQDGIDSTDETKNSKKTAELIKKVAGRGNAQAIYVLSMMYENGYHVEKDQKQSINLLKEAAEKSYPEAVYSLGYLYLIGHNVPKDTQKGIELLKKASNLGFSDASNNLSALYLNGEIVKKDYTEAKKWLEIGIQQGNFMSIFNMGYLYENGLGVKVDKVKAMELYKISADLKYKDGMLKVADFYNQGIGVKKDQELARAWLNKAIENDDARAMLVLANAYFFGDYGYAVDKVKANEWVKKAQSLGLKEAFEAEKHWKALERSKQAVNSINKNKVES